MWEMYGVPGLACPPSAGRQPVAGTAVLGRGCGPGVEPWAVTESRLVAKRGTVLGSFTWAALDNRGKETSWAHRDSSRLLTSSCWMFCQLLAGAAGQEVRTGGREAGQDTLTRSLQMAVGGGGKSGGQGLPDVLWGSPWARRTPGPGTGRVGGLGGGSAGR